MKKNSRFMKAVIMSAAIFIALPGFVVAEPVWDAGDIDVKAAGELFKKPGYSPYAGRNFPTGVFWGDTHVHTGWSVDAGAFGCNLGPEEAVRFARGEEIMSAHGEPVKLSRPLDWIVVADHSDGAGVIQELINQNPEMMADPTLKRWSDMIRAGGEEGVKASLELISAQANDKVPPQVKDKRLAKSVWQRNTDIMEKYNDPGRFTTLIGYEWTSNAGGGEQPAQKRHLPGRQGRSRPDDSHDHL